MFLLQPLKRYAKASNISFKLFGKKYFFKKGKGGRRCWADPPPFRLIQAVRPGLPSPLPRADARLTPPGAGHMAAVRRRCGRAARPTGLPRSGRHPVTPGAILSPPLPLLLCSRAQPQQQQPPRRHCRSKLRHSPQAALVNRSLRQDHRRVRLRRGKPLRALPR